MNGGIRADGVSVFNAFGSQGALTFNVSGGLLFNAGITTIAQLLDVTAQSTFKAPTTVEEALAECIEEMHGVGDPREWWLSPLGRQVKSPRTITVQL
mgnify:CR=1 FL=1